VSIEKSRFADGARGTTNRIGAGRMPTFVASA